MLDSLHLGADHQIYVTGKSTEAQRLHPAGSPPTVLINGRNMHYAYERGSLAARLSTPTICPPRYGRHNGRPQQHPYAETTPMRRWIYGPKHSSASSTTHADAECPRTRDVKIPSGSHPDAPRLPHPRSHRVARSHPRGKARVQFESTAQSSTRAYKCRNDSASTTASSSP
ncbi:hypothetical protein [Muribaculum intestinale]|uniref:hypothetical protein n=1 Tax=Muribaculum intestinale TaxID=1796646 RepID=UPI003F67E0B6